MTGLSKKETLLLSLIFFGALCWSGISPHDRFTWILEVFPAVIGFVVLLSTHKLFRFSRFTYWMLLVHAIILMVGGHYTYAKVPLFDELSKLFHWQRNNYDKVGHFFQGFTPALVSLELLRRVVQIKSFIWIAIITILSCLGISAIYELLEWAVALMSGANADAFLGTQGYVWDTQSDMFLALLGASFSVIVGQMTSRLKKLNPQRLKKEFP